MPTRPNDLFDPSLYSGVRRPVLEASTLPPWCYTDQGFFDREMQRIFAANWYLCGRGDAIPNAGDYFTIDLAGASIIILRGGDGEVRAFSNSCRHRGARLVDGSGNCGQRITCPYHSWTYALDGKLVVAGGMQRSVGFDPLAYGMLQVRLETYGGFLFINLSDGGPGLAQHLGDFHEQLGSYEFANLVCTRTKEYDVACNWKVYLENQREGYHVPTVHRTSLGSQGGDAIEYLQTSGQWSGAFFRKKTSEGVLRGEKAPFPLIPSLSGRAGEGTHFVAIFPNTFLGLSMDCVWWIECRPVSPSRTKLVVGSCFPKDTVALPGFAEDADKYYRRWDMTHGEDNAIAERQQLGLASTLARPGRFAYLETGAHQIDNWVLDRVLAQP